jgi:GST-like protein
MIRLYTAATPNGRKISIALEELDLNYETIAVTLADGDQNQSEFLRMNPNAKIPVLDDDGLVVFESGAILVHLAEKFGKLLPADPAARARVMTMTFFQAAHVGPNLGRLGSQFNLPDGERNDGMVTIFLEESLRVFGVLDTILAGDQDYLAGDYSIADIMTYPWIKAAEDAQAEFLEPYVNLAAWMDRVGARPAVARGMAVPE